MGPPLWKQDLLSILWTICQPSLPAMNKIKQGLGSLEQCRGIICVWSLNPQRSFSLIKVPGKLWEALGCFQETNQRLHLHMNWKCLWFWCSGLESMWILWHDTNCTYCRWLNTLDCIYFFFNMSKLNKRHYTQTWNTLISSEVYL